MPSDKLQEIRDLIDDVEEAHGQEFVLSSIEALAAAMLIVVDELTRLKAKVEPPDATQ